MLVLGVDYNNIERCLIGFLVELQLLNGLCNL